MAEVSEPKFTIADLRDANFADPHIEHQALQLSVSHYQDSLRESESIQNYAAAGQARFKWYDILKAEQRRRTSMSAAFFIAVLLNREIPRDMPWIDRISSIAETGIDPQTGEPFQLSA